MAKALHFISADLGAESGRVMLGHFDGEQLAVAEVHRFDSRPVRVPDGLHTDVLRIQGEIEAGLSAAARRAEGQIAGIAVDTWGVDFALVDAQGVLLGNPYHYRDMFSEPVSELVFRGVSRDHVYSRTGTGFSPINTLYQLLRLRLRGSAALDAADRLLMIPDLFTFWLTGHRTNEFTIATTTQCYDPARRAWARDLLEQLELPTRIFGEVVMPGTIVGELLPPIAAEARLGRVPVIAAGGHDTALAVAAVPARHPRFAYVSSGTWSLQGAEIDRPCIDERSRAGNFNNEGGVDGTIRFLKNVCGLWIVQECRRHWGGVDSYDDLTRAAAAARAWRSLIDVDDPRFGAPGDMPGRIREYCIASGQPAPETKGEIVRCALESLALKYNAVLDAMEDVLGWRADPLHIVGGGSRNALLCQLAADATGRAVHAGPVEATAAGNVVMQAIATGHLSSVAEGRALVRRSFDVAVYEPRHDPALEDAYARLLRLTELSSATKS